MAASSLARTEAIEPVMVRVPGGWFWMGCEIGRDDEKPLHRVWVDAFELAAYQVTNKEYACFLEAMMHPQPSCWNDSNFNHPKMPSSAGLRISLRGSNRVTCGGEKDLFSAREESYQEAEQHAHHEPDKLVTVQWEMNHSWDRVWHTYEPHTRRQG